MENISSLDTSIGIIHVTYNDEKILKLDFSPDKKVMYPETSSRLWLKCKKQLEEYFAGKRLDFDLPYEPAGSEFQKKVWDAMVKIPYGSTLSYKTLAEKVKSPQASRAVGNACNKNPLPLIIPCHRVVYSNGKLGGFAYDLQIKESLLGFERNLR